MNIRKDDETKSESSDLIARYKRQKKWQYLQVVVVLALVFILPYALETELGIILVNDLKITVAGWVFIASFAACIYGLTFFSKIWRCPGCGNVLLKGLVRQKRCKYCGAKLIG